MTEHSSPKASAKLTLEDNRHCFVCGERNPHGLHLKFEHPQPWRLRARFTFREEHQGFRRMVHGGLVGAILDEMMINLAWVEKTPAVTAEMTLRLLKPVPVGEPIDLEGRLDKDGGRVLYMSSLAKNAGGEVLAQASASCIRIRGEIQ